MKQINLGRLFSRSTLEMALATQESDEIDLLLALHAAIETKHKDLIQIVNQDKFWEWLRQQAPKTKALADSVHPRDVVKLLDSFEESRKSFAQ